jgi:hypothetical protein
MSNKRQEKNTHVLEVPREVLAPILCRRKTSNPKSSRTRTSMVSKKNLMGRTRPHILPNSRRRLLRRKEYGTRPGRPHVPSVQAAQGPGIRGAQIFI